MSAVHPNLLLNADELTGIRAKIDRYPWAAALFARATALADDTRIGVGRAGLENHIASAFTLTSNPASPLHSYKFRRISLSV